MLLELIANYRHWRQEKYAAAGVPQNTQNLESQEWSNPSVMETENWENPWEDPGEDKEWQDLEGPDLPSDW
jgi:hypothetical protein